MKDKLMDGYKMGWYRFVVNVGVFISAALSLYMGAMFIFIAVSKCIATNAGLGFTLLMGLISLIPATPWFWLVWVSFLTRNNLKKFKVEAPGDVYLLHVAPVVILAIEGVIALIGDFSWSLLVSLLILCLAWVVLMAIPLIFNYIYFEKREKLFCNE